MSDYSEYQNNWHTSPEEERAREAAEEYVRRCDAYDIALCGSYGIPRTGREVGLCSRNATRVRADVMSRFGVVDHKQFKTALIQVQRRQRENGT